MGAWLGSGLNPPNSRAVLVKLPTYREKVVPAPTPAPVPPTARNTKSLLHQARQAKLLLKPGSSLSSNQQEELADLIDSLERFAIGTDRDLQLERETNRKWRETQKLAAPVDRRDLQAQAISGKVLDAATLKYLYEERKRIDAKKATKGEKGNRGQMARKDIKGKQVQLDVSDNEDTRCSVIDISDSGAELETWEDDLDTDTSDSSIRSVITIATPNLRPLNARPPVIPSTPLPKAPSHSHLSVSTTPHRYVTRFRAARR